MRKESWQCLLQFRARKYINVTLKHRISTAGMRSRIVASFSLMKNCLFMQTCNILSRGDLSLAHKVAPCFSTGCPLRNTLVVMVLEKERYIRIPRNLTGLTHYKLFLTHATCQHGSAGMPIHVVTRRPRQTEGCTGAQLGGATRHLFSECTGQN